MPSTITRVTEIALVVVPVSDQERALSFYTERLGFEKRTDLPFGESDRWLEVAPPGSHTTLAIVPPRPGDPAGTASGISLVTTDIDAFHAELRAEGVDVDPEVMRMGDPVPPMFFLRDPDGNQLFVIERL
jgi:catechol 2,3-dioxygenase-like lactoylglutathione lyase family enzyme